MKTKKEIIVIAKLTAKRNGAVIYQVRSNIPNKLGCIDGCDQVERNGKWFDVYQVSSDGEYVFGCQTSGEQCKGNMYRGTCCHRKHVQKLLDAAKCVKAVTAPVVEEPKPVKPRWNNWAARWDDPTTGKPTAFLGGVPYWNETDGFLAHPDGKIWNEWMEEWIEPVPAKRLEDISARGSLNGSAQTAQMPEWLRILPSRQVATHA